jgi:hypothetical protein
MAAVKTYEDLYNAVLDGYGELSRSDRNARLAKMACQNAIRDLCGRRMWRWYTRRSTITSVASVSDTATYVASTRTWTFTSALPDNAERYRIIHSGNHYSIATSPGSTTAVSPLENAPAEDISSAESVTLYRNAYYLPLDFRKLRSLFDVTSELEIPIADDAVQHSDSVLFYDTPDWPRRAAIRNTGEIYIGLELVFSPPPNEARTYDVMYEAEPRAMKVLSETAGTITVSSLSVTGVGTAFTSDMVGSVIRLTTSTTDAPTSVEGYIANSNPYDEYRVITAVASGTSLTIDQAVTGTYSGTKYSISDPLDIDVTAMYTCLLRMAEAEYGRLSGAPDLQTREQLAARELERAKENDNRTTHANRGYVAYDKFSRVTITDDA